MSVDHTLSNLHFEQYCLLLKRLGPKYIILFVVNHVYFLSVLGHDIFQKYYLAAASIAMCSSYLSEEVQKPYLFSFCGVYCQ